MTPWWESGITEKEYRPKYPDSPFFHVCDYVNPKTGKTYREENAGEKHNIPIGTLVEILPDEYNDDPLAGTRLFVVLHNRDCDQTPLYSLCADSSDIIVEKEGFGNRKWYNGYPEHCLRVIAGDIRRET